MPGAYTHVRKLQSRWNSCGTAAAQVESRREPHLVLRELEEDGDDLGKVLGAAGGGVLQQVVHDAHPDAPLPVGPPRPRQQLQTVTTRPTSGHTARLHLTRSSND